MAKFSDNVVISNIEPQRCSECGAPLGRNNKHGKCQRCTGIDHVVVMLKARGIDVKREQLKLHKKPRRWWAKVAKPLGSAAHG